MTMRKEDSDIPFVFECVCVKSLTMKKTVN